MDRLEAMLTIERYGNNLACVQCGHTYPSLMCNAHPTEEIGEIPCPLLRFYQEQETEDDVLALAEEIRARA